MADIFLSCLPDDQDRAGALAEALGTLSLAVEADSARSGRRAGAKALKDKAKQAKAVVIAVSGALAGAATLPAALLAAAQAAAEDRLVVALLDGPAERLPAPLDTAAAVDLSGFLASPERRQNHEQWQAFIRAIAALAGRPGLPALAEALAADGADGLDRRAAFARAYPEDAASVAIWAAVEARETRRFEEAYEAAQAGFVTFSRDKLTRLRATREAFDSYLKALRTDAQAAPPDPRAAVSDEAEALRARVARLSAETASLADLANAAERERIASRAKAARSRYTWASAAALALILGGLAGAAVTEVAGPIRGDKHPRIAELAAERAQSLAALSQTAAGAAAKAEATETRNAELRRRIARLETENANRQRQAAGLQTELQSARAELQRSQSAAKQLQAQLEGAQAAAAALQRQVAEAGERASARQAEAQAQAQAPAQAPAQPQVQAAAPPTPQPRPEAAPEITGSVARPSTAAPAAEAYRHRGERWSLSAPAGFHVESDNDLPGPVNTVVMRDNARDAVIVISANNAAAAGACSAEDWYVQTIVDAGRPRRGRFGATGTAPRNAHGLAGITARGSGVLHGDRLRLDLDFYDIAAQHRAEPGVVYLIQARFPRAMANEMVQAVNELWRSFQLTGPRAYPTRC